MSSLAGVAVSLIGSIRIYDAREATAEWGMGHPHRTIQVITLG
jgi:hypothetical protein